MNNIMMISLKYLVTSIVEYAMFGEEVGPTKEYCVGSLSVGLLHKFYKRNKQIKKLTIIKQKTTL